MKKHLLLIPLVILIISSFFDFRTFKNVISNYLITHEIKEYITLEEVREELLNNKGNKDILLDAYRSTYETSTLLDGLGYNKTYQTVSAVSGLLIPIIILLYLLNIVKNKRMIYLLFILLIIPSLVIAKINFETANDIEMQFQKDFKKKQKMKFQNRQRELEKSNDEQAIEEAIKGAIEELTEEDIEKLNKEFKKILED